MERKQLTIIVVVAALVVALAILFSFGLSSISGNSWNIQLPDTSVESGQDPEQGGSPGGELTDGISVTVTTRTVREVVDSLERPEAYSASLTAERFWAEGGSRESISLQTDGRLVRTDRVGDSGQVRHSIWTGDEVYVWYGSQRSWFTGGDGDFTRDDDAAIPTYEDLVNLKEDEIAQAAYVALGERACIYAETVPNEAGLSVRYWVEVESGLLVQAEYLLDGNTSYRVTMDSLELTAPGEDAFRLPDGSRVKAR